jgi:putative transposase
MVQREGSQLSIRQQCRALSLHRSNLYYEPQPVSAENLALMRVIDATYLKHPELGRRGMTLSLRRQGHPVNVKRVRRLMQLMGLESLAPKPNLSRSHPEHKKYPYLLKGIEVTRANQVWATDISYIPLASGFLYLVAIIDWYSRAVLAWRLSNTLDTSFCIEALQDALDRWGKPDIFNSDQGVQFTSEDFTAILKAKGVQISMDGKGRCLDNVFVERLWRSLKYEEVYLRAYEGPREARRGIGGYLGYFNNDRPHQALGGKTPREVYVESIALQTRRAA